jgi:type II secretory pathway pseudopilin PulG
LVELLLVIAIFSITAIIAVPAIKPTQPYKLDLAATHLADALRHARAEALRMANPHGIHIETSQKRIRVFRGADATLPPTPVYDVYHPLTKRLYELDLDSGSMPEGVTLSASSSWSETCDQPAVLGFDAVGTPRCGDPWSAVLETSTFTLTYAGHTRSVIVDGVTGRVTLQ